MAILNKILWTFMTDGQKLDYLRKRGLTIGQGCEVLNGWNFGSEPYLVTIGDNVRITAGVTSPLMMGESGFFVIFIPSLLTWISSGEW